MSQKISISNLLKKIGTPTRYTHFPEDLDSQLIIEIAQLPEVFKPKVDQLFAFFPSRHYRVIRDEIGVQKFNQRYYYLANLKNNSPDSFKKKLYDAERIIARKQSQSMKSSDTFSLPRIKEEGDVKMDTLTSPSPAAVTSPSPHPKIY